MMSSFYGDVDLEELDQVVVKHVEEQKKKWELAKGFRGEEEDGEMEVDGATTSNGSAPASSTKKPAEAASSMPSVAQEFYDDIYFDSDDNDDDDNNDDRAGNDKQNQENTPENAGSAVDRIQRTIDENEQLEK